MATSSEKIRAYTGPALFSYGFRPFFLFGAAWAAIAVAVWLPFLAGAIHLPTKFSPLEWHVHELIYGYVPAVVAGFLLTAVPNWTGRLPVVGLPLVGLFATWVAGRLAILTSGLIGAVPAAVIDLGFLVLFGAVVAREIIAGRNWRNLKVLVAIALLFIGNLLFHLEAMSILRGGVGTRFGIATTILLIMLIGGRIIPSFTRNWLVRREPGRLPEPFSKVDTAVMIASGVTLACWVIAPETRATAALAAVACAMNIVRLTRWAGNRTFAEPLVAILHVAYSFIPIGFLMLVLSILAPNAVATAGALHAWTAGAIGTMTLAVMTRASLGHTGQPLAATPAIIAIYASVVVAALARLLAAFWIAREPMLHLSATAWVCAFGGFVIVYAPLLLRRR